MVSLVLFGSIGRGWSLGRSLSGVHPDSHQECLDALAKESEQVARG